MKVQQQEDIVFVNSRLDREAGFISDLVDGVKFHALPDCCILSAQVSDA